MYSPTYHVTYAYILVGTFLYIMCMYVCERESTSVFVCMCVREREYWYVCVCVRVCEREGGNHAACLCVCV